MFQSNAENLAKTISKEVSFSGISLHSGIESTLTFRPSEKNGICFIYKGRKTLAVAENVTNTTRGTTLGNILVVEHVLSAIAGLGIDAIEVVLSAEEPPAADGSALPFVSLLEKAGLTPLSHKRDYLEISKEVIVGDRETFLKLEPFNGFEIDFTINFPGHGEQRYVYKNDYAKEIAPARTFGYIEELEELKARGLAKGASLETALGLSSVGYVNAPRFDNEPVRHKILDLIGDLSLVGRPIHAKIIARKSGHKLNVELANKLRGLIKC